ncbi:unnamed protein product [Albugo candida]|uniref:RxLR effector protein n=1 Tax=Albugo candida TaxID=65357 RepID=A0A024GPK5_9STRA|nr:unnamed protein product [Albugo candida]|eukprot:CCI48287.1 unnamed protein product [Albugo candida]
MKTPLVSPPNLLLLSAVALIRGGEVNAYPGSSSQQPTGGHVEPKVPMNLHLNSALLSGYSRTGKITVSQYRKKGDFGKRRTNCEDQHENALVDINSQVHPAYRLRSPAEGRKFLPITKILAMHKQKVRPTAIKEGITRVECRSEKSRRSYK